MHLLLGVLQFLETSKYGLIFLGSYFEGTVVMISSGLLWHLGKVAFWPMYLALIAGDFLSDLTWYFIGYFGARPFVNRWGHLVGASPDVVVRVERRFKMHETPILILSKLTMGFGLMIATLITAGMLRVSLWKFTVINLFGGFIWIFFLILIGYFFGNILEYIPPQFQIASAILAVIVLFFGIKQLSASLAKSDW